MFASAGVAWVGAEARVCDDAGCTDGSTFDFDDVGAVVGAGFEYAMTDNFRLRVDGSYYFINDNRDLSGVDEADTSDFLELDDVYTVRVGGTWYFNSRRHSAPLK